MYMEVSAKSRSTKINELLWVTRKGEQNENVILNYLRWIHIFNVKFYGFEIVKLAK